MSAKLRGLCSGCHKWLVLVHKLKTNPDGRLPRHKGTVGRTCFGIIIAKKGAK